MGYDLNFWKYKDGADLDDQSVYESLSSGETIDGVIKIDTEAIRNRVEEEFLGIGWNKLGPNDFEGINGTFQIYKTAQLFRIDCYGMTGEDMNRFIDICSEFGCPLYDPQTQTRYEEG